jgi:hypothetical protein
LEGGMTTPIAAMVLEMIAKGVDPEVIAMAVSAAEQALILAARPQTSTDSTTVKRREKDRLRQQEIRRNRQTSTDICGNPQVPLSKNIDLEEKREAASADVGGLWFAPDGDWKDAIEKLGEHTATAELVKFREINRRPPGAKKDSDFRIWVQRAVEYLAAKKPVAPSSVPPSDFVIDWDRACEFFKKTGKWWRDAGPEPGMTGCRCPSEILQKHGLRSEAA